MTFKSSSSSSSKPKPVKRTSPSKGGKEKKTGTSSTPKTDPRYIMVMLKSMGISNPSRGMVLNLSEYASGTFSNWLSKYKKMGQVNFDGKNCSITPAGEAAVGTPMSPIQSNSEMQQRIKQMFKLQGMSLKAFEILLGHATAGVDRDELMTAISCSHPGTFTNSLSKLRKPGLVETVAGQKNMIRCTDMCFPMVVAGRPGSGWMSRGDTFDAEV